jgi:Marseilleviridae peptidase
MSFKVKGQLEITKGIGPMGDNGNISIGAGANPTTVGRNNVAIGDGALAVATSLADFNVAIGENTLANATSGDNNIAIGTLTMSQLTTALNNIGVGVGSMPLLTIGSGNTGVGTGAGVSLTTGFNNLCLGRNADVSVGTAQGRIAIGCDNVGGFAVATADNGLFFHKSLATAAGAAVQYNAATGQMGPVASSIRFKDNVTDIEVDSTKIFQIRPVSYSLIGDTSSSPRREFGFLAEDVIEVLPELAPTDAKGQPMSVNYDRFVVLIIEELRKLREDFDRLEHVVTRTNGGASVTEASTESKAMTKLRAELRALREIVYAISN